MKSRRFSPLVPCLALLAALACGSPRRALGEGAGTSAAGIDPRPASALPAGELRQALSRLRVLGSVLYIGAHPDDDNTSLLAYLARGRGVRTTYLSLTRGDGGQNILGTETGELLGVLRTQELLASRRVDGAGQLFGRALDFGFSKSPDEALEVWGHDRTLADMVWLIRLLQPDVIVTRFGTDGSGGHGHHTASAILAGEAFRAAADSTRFPDQLGRVATWRAKRLLWNTWAPKLEGRASGAPPLLTIEIGAFDPELGASYPEIGGRSRSLNRSQGAGTPERRGRRVEYFEQVDGEFGQRDALDAVEMGWSRLAGGGAVDSALAQAERAFDPAHPEAVLPQLARAHAAMRPLEARAGANAPRVAYQLAQLEAVMRGRRGPLARGQCRSAIGLSGRYGGDRSDGDRPDRRAGAHSAHRAAVRRARVLPARERRGQPDGLGRRAWASRRARGHGLRGQRGSSAPRARGQPGDGRLGANDPARRRAIQPAVLAARASRNRGGGRARRLMARRSGARLGAAGAHYGRDRRRARYVRGAGHVSLDRQGVRRPLSRTRDSAAGDVPQRPVGVSVFDPRAARSTLHGAEHAFRAARNTSPAIARRLACGARQRVLRARSGRRANASLPRDARGDRGLRRAARRSLGGGPRLRAQAPAHRRSARADPEPAHARGIPPAARRRAGQRGARSAI